MTDKKEKFVDFNKGPNTAPQSAERDTQKEYPALVSIDLTTGKVSSNGFDATPNQETGDPHVKVDGGKGKE